MQEVMHKNNELSLKLKNVESEYAAKMHQQITNYELLLLKKQRELDEYDKKFDPERAIYE